VCRRLRTAACGGGRRGRAGGQHGRGRVCPGGWGEGRRIRCRGRGSASSGFATVGGVAGADAVRGRAGVAIARGWRQARGRGRGRAHVGGGCRWMCVCEYGMGVWASRSKGSLVTATGPLSVFVVRLG
jgi:hypothetical protein